MNRPSFGNILVATPASCARYNHTRGLRERCVSLHEFDYDELLTLRGAVAARERLARLVAEKKIDVLFISFYGDNYLFPPEFLLELKKTTRIVLWTWDDESTFHPQSRYYAAAVDAVVTTDYFSVAAYRALGFPAVLCFGNVSPSRYPALGLPRDIDVSFVGHCLKADRPRYLDFLASNGIRVESFGFGSSAGFISDEEMPRIFSRSKINLNFSRLDSGSMRTTGHKVRPMEVAMTRSFCLSEYYPALPRVFELGREIDVFDDPDSLLKKVRHYLAHEDEREKYAAAAYARVLRDYEDGPCITRVVDELKAVFDGPVRPVRLATSPEFKKRQIAALTVHGASLLRRGRLGACARIIPELFQHGTRLFLAGAAAGAARGFAMLRRKIS